MTFMPEIAFTSDSESIQTEQQQHINIVSLLK